MPSVHMHVTHKLVHVWPCRHQEWTCRHVLIQWHGHIRITFAMSHPHTSSPWPNQHTHQSAPTCSPNRPTLTCQRAHPSTFPAHAPAHTCPPARSLTTHAQSPTSPLAHPLALPHSPTHP